MDEISCPDTCWSTFNTVLGTLSPVFHPQIFQARESISWGRCPFRADIFQQSLGDDGELWQALLVALEHSDDPKDACVQTLITLCKSYLYEFETRLADQRVTLFMQRLQEEKSKRRLEEEKSKRRLEEESKQRMTRKRKQMESEMSMLPPRVYSVDDMKARDSTYVNTVLRGHLPPPGIDCLICDMMRHPDPRGLHIRSILEGNEAWGFDRCEAKTTEVSRYLGRDVLNEAVVIDIIVDALTYENPVLVHIMQERLEFLALSDISIINKYIKKFNQEFENDDQKAAYKDADDRRIYLQLQMIFQRPTWHGRPVRVTLFQAAGASHDQALRLTNLESLINMVDSFGCGKYLWSELMIRHLPSLMGTMDPKLLCVMEITHRLGDVNLFLDRLCAAIDDGNWRGRPAVCYTSYARFHYNSPVPL